MFVVHAVVLTFFITPLTALIYPKKYHNHTTVCTPTTNTDLEDSSSSVTNRDRKEGVDFTAETTIINRSEVSHTI